MKNDTIHNVLNVVVWGGAIGGALAGLTIAEWMAIGGFFIALASFLVNWWHKRRMIKIEEFKAGMKR